MQIYFKDKYFSTTVGLILSSLKENIMISPCKTAQNPKNFALRAQFSRRAVNIFQILTNVARGGGNINLTALQL